MERRSHDNKRYVVAGKLSRMAQDLQECSDNFKSSFKSCPAIRNRASAPEVERTHNLRVSVIGAGLAGLRCAELLIEAGVDVVVLEARNRIGGRVHQELLDGSLVDMGASWVHGTEGNPVVQIFGEVGTKIEPFGEQTMIFDPSGDTIDDERADELNDVIERLTSEAFGYSNQNCAEIASDLSLKDFFLEHLPKYGLSQDDNSLVMKMAETWGSFIGDNWDKQSLKWFWLECLNSENVFVVDTHKAIIEKIATPLRSQRNVQLETKATGVENIVAPHDDPLIRVTIEHDGEKTALEFDEVVVAVPLGCLKRKALAFSPPLPTVVATAIENASISTLEKIFVSFPTAFWDFSVPLNDAVDNGPVEDQRVQDSFSGFATFLTPSYAPQTHRSFVLEANAMSNPHVFGDAARPTLNFWLFGDFAHEMTSSIGSLSPSDEQYFRIIDEFVKPYYSRLPNYDSTRHECTPSAVLATNWRNDDLAGNGSYTNFKISEPERKVMLDDDIRAMRTGMPERGIWFAGEHVAPFVGLGTTTGAYWSGESVAMKILGANGLPTSIESCSDI